MLLTREAISDAFCETVKVKKKTELVCNFTEIESSLAFNNTLYDGPVGLIIVAVTVLLHFVFWLINYNVKNNVNKNYIFACFLPLSFSSIFKLAQLVNIIVFDNAEGYFEIFAMYMYSISIASVYITAALGAGCLLFVKVFNICKPGMEMNDSWVMFTTVQLLGWIGAAAYHLTTPEYHWMPTFLLMVAIEVAYDVMLVAMIAGLVCICSCLGCCKGRMKDQDEKTRVRSQIKNFVFGLIFVLIFCVPTYFAIVSYFDESMVLRQGRTWELYGKELDRELVKVFLWYRVVEFFTAPLMLLLVFILPEYHRGLIAVPAFVIICVKSSFSNVLRPYERNSWPRLCLGKIKRKRHVHAAKATVPLLQTQDQKQAGQQPDKTDTNQPVAPEPVQQDPPSLPQKTHLVNTPPPDLHQQESHMQPQDQQHPNHIQNNQAQYAPASHPHMMNQPLVIPSPQAMQPNYNQANMGAYVQIPPNYQTTVIYNPPPIA